MQKKKKKKKKKKKAFKKYQPWEKFIFLHLVENFADFWQNNSVFEQKMSHI